MLVAALVGIFVSIGLHFLNLGYALLIGLFAGLLDVIPYFGAFIGALPAVGLALVSSPLLAFKVIVLFVIIHQLEGLVIHPQIMGEKVGLQPLSVIFWVFIGGELGGFTGMLLGVPAAAVGKVIVKHIRRGLV